MRVVLMITQNVFASLTNITIEVPLSTPAGLLLHRSERSPSNVPAPPMLAMEFPVFANPVKDR